MFKSGCALLGAMLLAAAIPAEASSRGWSRASTIARNVVVAGSLGVPALQGDWDGALQAGGSVGVAFLATEGLKQIFPEMRPDGSNRKSFPSAHSASAFAAAATLQNRYGWQVGVPAQIVATFVGFARVKGEKHNWYDVVAGAAIGEASGFLITSRRDQNVRIMPWAGSKGGGVAMAMRF